MKECLKILLVIAVSFIAGSYFHKCQSPPGNIIERSRCESDTTHVYDTISYYMPKAQSEVATGTQRYTLPMYYFKGSDSGVESRCSNIPDSLDAGTRTLTTQYGGAGGERRYSRDSLIAELPVIQRRYADSTYEAWVSGPLDPRLDSIRVFAPTTIITKREWKPPKRWHIGPTIGYGITPQGLQPYIGVGVTYSIISL